LIQGEGSEAARVHQRCCWFGSRFAARGARAAPYKVGDRIPGYGFARLEGFRLGLRDFGYVEGTNVVVEYRFAEGHYERLPELAADLVRSKVDLIVTHGTPGSLAAKRAALPLFATGLGTLGLLGWRRKRKAQAGA
jgi:hypothetical protein